MSRGRLEVFGNAIVQPVVVCRGVSCTCMILVRSAGNSRSKSETIAWRSVVCFLRVILRCCESFSQGDLRIIRKNRTSWENQFRDVSDRKLILQASVSGLVYKTGNVHETVYSGLVRREKDKTKNFPIFISGESIFIDRDRHSGQ